MCASARVSWNGWGRRGATILHENELVHVPEFCCHRAKCTECGEDWRVLPPRVIPHKHYQPCVVARAVGQYLFEEGATQEAVARRHGCSRRTVGRWVEWMAGLADPAVLARKVMEAVDAPLVPPVRRVAAIARKSARGATDVLMRAAEVLGLVEDLGSAWGLEPPGLRSVLERTVGDRSGVATYARPLVPELARGPPV